MDYSVNMRRRKRGESRGANQTKRDILYFLAENGSSRRREIQKHLKKTPYNVKGTSTILTHLIHLREENLVVTDDERPGSTAKYSLAEMSVDELGEALEMYFIGEEWEFLRTSEVARIIDSHRSYRSRVNVNIAILSGLVNSDIKSKINLYRKMVEDRKDLSQDLKEILLQNLEEDPKQIEELWEDTSMFPPFQPSWLARILPDLFLSLISPPEEKDTIIPSQALLLGKVLSSIGYPRIEGREDAILLNAVYPLLNGCIFSKPYDFRDILDEIVKTISQKYDVPFLEKIKMMERFYYMSNFSQVEVCSSVICSYLVIGDEKKCYGFDHTIYQNRREEDAENVPIQDFVRKRRRRYEVKPGMNTCPLCSHQIITYQDFYSHYDVDKYLESYGWEEQLRRDKGLIEEINRFNNVKK